MRKFKLLSLLFALCCATSMNAQIDVPLTLEAMEAGAEVTFSNISGIEYSTDGSTWNSYTGGDIVTLANVGDKVSFRGHIVSSLVRTISCSKDCYVYGNIMSLVNSTDYASSTTLSIAFENLFANNTHIKNHPTKTLELPATTLLEEGCYRLMFYGCTGLTRAPELPATTMLYQCYLSMFQGCTGLTTAPELPATTLAAMCYRDMFNGCTGLTTAPVLPATTLTGFCYAGMFRNCSNLTHVTCLAPDVSAWQCTQYWLDGVAAAGTFVTPSATSWESGVNGIPDGWTRTINYLDANFAIDFTTDPYTKVGGGLLPADVEVSGTYNDNQHGYYNAAITIPVKAGNYKVTLGACGFGSGEGAITNEDGSVPYASFNQKLAENSKCYHQNTAENIVVMIITIPADQKIVVDCGNYTPYFAIQKMAAVPAFTDFEINFQSDPYTLVSGAKPAGTVIAGSYYNDGQHGYKDVEATVPMEAGTYRLTLGKCQYGVGPGNVMSETNVELASFSQSGACYVASTGANTVSVTFTVDIDQTITIYCDTYTPYMKLEKISAYNVAYTLGDAEGTAPVAVDVTIGDALTMRVNRTMYKAGYTLTGWNDGATTYAIGAALTPTSDVVLTPVFTANAVAITEAAEPVTVRWYFGKSHGAPPMHLEGNSGILVTQATVAGNPIDVRLDIDATAGKFYNATYTNEWAQVLANTTFTFPAKDGTTVDLGVYTSPASYSVIDNVLTANDEQNYYGYLEVTYPDPNVNITTKVDPDHAGIYYSTFYDSAKKYALPNDGTEAYAAEVNNGAMYLHKIAEGNDVLPAGTAVIFKATSGTITLTESNDAPIAISVTNHLHGVDVDTEISSAVSGTCYVLSGGSNGVGFYTYQAPNLLKAHKAYIDLNGGGAAQAPKHLRFVFDSATAIETTEADVKAEKRIENGVLYIIKNGVKYNAQGQTVK